MFKGNDIKPIMGWCRNLSLTEDELIFRGNAITLVVVTEDVFPCLNN